MRWDVFICECATRKIASVAGTDLLSEDEPGHGFHTLEKRMETVMGRINEAFFVAKAPAGKFKEGDALPEGEE